MKITMKRSCLLRASRLHRDLHRDVHRRRRVGKVNASTKRARFQLR